MNRLLLLLCFMAPFTGWSQQDDAWFYLTAYDSSFVPTFTTSGKTLRYTGNDKILKKVLQGQQVYQFKKTYRNAKKTELHRTFFVRCESELLMNELLDKASHLFYAGSIVSEEDKKIYEPNDYGLTSTLGENIGAQVNLDYLDFLGVPKAWYYTTGNPDILVGISDGYVDTLDAEFKDRTKMYQKSSVAKGHGYSVAETAIGTGDNGYGIAGICYNCSVGTTTFGGGKKLKQLVELSNAGAKVINCSWGREGVYYEEAEEVIAQLYKNGTILVATGGNTSYYKKRKINYPAGYDNVIAVSSAQHRFSDYRENIIKGTNKKGKPSYYAENVCGFVGRTAGFRENDTLRPPYIYPASVSNLNHSIDVMGPATGVFRYGELALKESEATSIRSQTSGVAPLVTGTIGLMFSLYPCLPTDEVESILKMTSWNIDHIAQNKPYKGEYGAGIIQTGDAVEMIYQLYNEKETAYIKDQNFRRWDFKLTSLSKELRMQNQKFTDSATLRITAKRRIVLSENTHLKPNTHGSIRLKIDSSLKKECDLVLRDPSILDD